MKQHFLVSIPLFLVVCTLTLSEAQTAAGPAPPGPTNITKILEKAGQFTTFMRLLKITQVGDQINTQLNNSNQGLTVFAPTDNAFSGLKPGTLNTLTDQEKVELVQFHVLSSYFSLSQFQTASNPLRTQAGDSAGAFPLNVTTAGNQVNVSTGVVDSPVSNSIYTDGQLAVYQVDKVLLPISLFGTPAPAAAPAPTKSKKKSKAADSPVSGEDAAPTDSSGGVIDVVHGMVAAVVAGVASIAFML